MASLKHFTFLFVIVLSILVQCPSAQTAVDVPDVLQEWVPWVLHGEEEQQCTQVLAGQQRLCVWPQPLELHLDAAGGSFAQAWQLQRQGWIFLPGNEKNWPREVRINQDPALVLNHKGSPAIYAAEPGQYVVAGRFIWPELPDSLTIPQGTALLGPFTIKGVMQTYPDIAGNTLWLSRKTTAGVAQQQDTLSLQVYRHVKDSIPLLMTSRLELQVSGKPREVVLDWELPGDQIPVQLESQLPVKLEHGNRIRMQVRAGKYTVTYHSRSKGPVDSLQLGSFALGPDEEFWSFEAQNHLRMVKIEGVPAVDPSQTSIPEAWQAWPAYRISKGDTFSIKTIKRGDPEPAPNQITLNRTLWLDDDGHGITVLDKLSGSISRSRRLEMQAPAALGRMVINGRDQLITTLEGQGRAGVEVRQGNIEATAVSRIDGVSTFPAGGWSQNITKLSGLIQLPPGWKILHVRGADSANTWLSRWTLLDCFIVLVIVFATAQLLGITKGLVALMVLVLTYHDQDAPVFIWLSVLALIAMLRALPESPFAKRLQTGKFLLLIGLVLIVLPYSVQQLRVGIFPQLDTAYVSFDSHPLGTGDTMQVMPSTPTGSMEYAGRVQSAMKASANKMERAPAEKKTQQYSYDTNAKIQAGPGIPAWQWRSIRLQWNGPVDASLNLQLFLLSPGVNLLLAVVKVALLLLLTFCMFEGKGIRGNRMRLWGGAPQAVLALLLVWNCIPTPAQASAIPGNDLLDQLRARLVEPSPCQPFCADFDSMDITMNGASMGLSIVAHCTEGTAVPLPGGDNIFWRAIQVDGKVVPVYGKEKTLLLPLSAGTHTISLEGVANRSPVQLSLPLKPHVSSFNGNGQWAVDGIAASGVPGDHLQFTQQKELGKKTDFGTSTLPPFIRVERILHFDLKWQVETIVTRLSPAGTAVYLNVPLLEGEAVTDPGLDIEKNGVKVKLAPGEKQKTWSSVFRQQANITLNAADTTEWFEVWRLDANPIWHVQTGGLVPVHHHSGAGIWQPEWRPWPGEQVELNITRPAGVAGETKAIESSVLKIQPGLRSTDMHLRFSMRSTRGDRQQVTIPEDGSIQSIRINGKEQAFGQNNGQVNLPISPGTQAIEIDWRMPGGIATLFRVPHVDLGSESVNTTTEVIIAKRWVWFVSGPRMGPAILFYSEVLILLLVAIILGRSGWTPLGSLQWVVLGLGLSQSGMITSGIIVLWFIALEQRRRGGGRLTGVPFNAMQFLLIVLSLAAFVAFTYAVRHGLLGHPDMLIEGNNSSSHLLRWYQDRVSGVLPQPTILSVPVMAYRAVMLIWALWLAFSFIKWVKWGWQCFTKDKSWQPVELKIKKRKKKEVNTGK